jgi:hypothetical protein
MRAFSGMATSTRSYVLYSTHPRSIPRDIGWNSGPWALRTGYREGYTREELDALPEGFSVVKEWIGGQVVLEVRPSSP